MIFFVVMSVIALVAYCLYKLAPSEASTKSVPYSFSAEPVLIEVSSFEGIKDNNMAILEDNRNISQNLFRTETGYLDSASVEIRREMTITIKGSEKPLCKVNYLVTYAGQDILIDRFGFLYPGFQIEKAYYSTRGTEKVEGNFTFRVLDRFENVPFVFSLPNSDSYEIVSSKRF